MRRWERRGLQQRTTCVGGGEADGRVAGRRGRRRGAGSRRRRHRLEERREIRRGRPRLRILQLQSYDPKRFCDLEPLQKNHFH
jgi:hypothetical protein